jgi:hypothetical protein
LEISTVSYQITLDIDENSPQARNIERLAETEKVSREEAALKLLANHPNGRSYKASPAARRILGAFSSPEDAAIMDEAVALAMEERVRRNAQPPR